MKRHFEKKAIARFFIAMCIGIVLELLGSEMIQESAHALVPTGVQTSHQVVTTGTALPQDSNTSQQLRGNSKTVPIELEGVGVSEHLGQTLDSEHIQLIDSEDGKSHSLKEYFLNGKPTLINLVYFECPMLCTLVLNGVSDGMKNMGWSIGKEFNVLTISINPNDTVGMAQAKRENYIKAYSEKSHDLALAHAGWRFLIGTEDQIKKLAAGLGFDYKYDTVQKQYAHAAVTFVLTPEGQISRYLYGITYKPKDLRLALLEASQGKVGNVFDRMLMFCYHYEPSSRGYTLQAVRVMQAGGAGTVVFLGGFLTLFWTRQRKGRMK